jgi:phage-related protein
VRRNGFSEVEIFLDSLGANLKASGSGILVMMEAHSEAGAEQFNVSQCHYVDQRDQIYEYIKGRIRVFWFEDVDRVVICTHGIIKKDQKTPKPEIDRAKRIKRDYLEAKSASEIIFLEEE